jgi:hypothetical protein
VIHETDVESKLRSLTPRQCQILYWLCHSVQTGEEPYEIKELAYGFKKSEPTIYNEMALIYELFGIASIRPYEERRRFLLETVCPVQLKLIANPDKDCEDKLFQRGEPMPPNPKTVALVTNDLKKGLWQLGGPLVPLKPQKGTKVIRIGGEPPEPPPPPNPIWRLLPWTLVVILGALLVIVLLTRQPALPSQTTMTTPPVSTSTPIVAPTPFVTTVVVTPTPLPSLPSGAPTSIGPVQSQSPLISPMPTSADVQNPPPGSIIPAGQGYTKNGVTLTIGNSLDLRGSDFGFSLTIENQSSRQLAVL